MRVRELMNMSVLKQPDVKVNDGDYIQDDLLFCGKCHSPKQVKLVYQGVEIKPYCLCKCEAEKLEKQKREEDVRLHLECVENLLSIGMPEKRMRSWCFEADDCANEKISMVARKYVEHFDEMAERGKGLLLYGSVGTGKSFISACIANALISKEIPCYFTSLSRLVNELSGRQDKQAFIDQLSGFPLLIIDDLASERDTEYMNEMVLNIIDERYRSGRPLIVTTNLTAEELKNPIDVNKQRLFSRLLEMCIPVEVKGKDRRKSKLKDDYQDLQGLLGL